MRKISTTILSKKLGLKFGEAISRLVEEGYIEQAEGKHKITKKGFENGAEYHESPKYGRYPVWPEKWTQEADRIGIYCCACEGIVKPSLVDGKRIYPDQANLHDKKFWLCRKCDNYIGCYVGRGRGTRPLGCLGTPEIRDKRKLIHQKTDPIWKNGKMDRKELYELIGNKLGYGWEYHAGHIRSLRVADEVIEIVTSIESDLGIN